jgi:hypothetical protein
MSININRNIIYGYDLIKIIQVLPVIVMHGIKYVNERWMDTYTVPINDIITSTDGEIEFEIYEYQPYHFTLHKQVIQILYSNKSNQKYYFHIALTDEQNLKIKNMIN